MSNYVLVVTIVQHMIEVIMLLNHRGGSKVGKLRSTHPWLVFVVVTTAKRNNALCAREEGG